MKKETKLQITASFIMNRNWLPKTAFQKHPEPVPEIIPGKRSPNRHSVFPAQNLISESDRSSIK